MIYGVERLEPAVLAEKIKKKELSTDDIRDQRLPGPLSFIDWIKLVLKESAYGDEIVILVMSLLWQLKITVLYADDLSERKFRHNQRITQVDMLLVYSGDTQHFVGAGRGLYFIQKRLHPFWKRPSEALSMADFRAVTHTQ